MCACHEEGHDRAGCSCSCHRSPYGLVGDLAAYVWHDKEGKA